MKRHSLVSFLACTFAITWGLALVFVIFPGPLERLFGEMSASNPIFVLATYAPLLSAVMVTWRQGGKAGLRDLWARSSRWRIHPLWYAGVLVGIPCLGALAATLAGSSLHPGSGFGMLAQMPARLFAGFLLGGLSEEPGWRGFALPRLLEVRGPLFGGLLLGLVWGVWHLPAYVISGTPQASGSPVVDFAGFMIIALALSVLQTWVCQRTEGSALVGGLLLHSMYNATMDVFDPPHITMGIVLLTAALAVVLIDRKVFRAAPSAPTSGGVVGMR